MANEFNKYFSSVAKNINTKQNEFSPSNVDNITPLHYLNQSFNNPLPKFNLKTVSTKEIKNIIKSLSQNFLGIQWYIYQIAKNKLPLYYLTFNPHT